MTWEFFLLVALLAFAVPILLGAVTSTPLAAYTVHKLPLRSLKLLIALLAIALGIATLVRAAS